MKNILILTISVMLAGCASEPDYQLSASTKHIKAVQVLDPTAGERNDGIVNSLDGQYGKKVINAYHKSDYEAKTARQLSQQQGGSGKSN
jgi:starvation-inducible outer membrane lipoprotein